MTDRPIGILFLCTGNSARSIIAEKLMADLGGEEFAVFSAGSQPTGAPNAFALEVLRKNGNSVEGVRSKSWNEFLDADATPIDIVITVCDSAASEACPIWPGHPMQAHWGVEDPAAVDGDDEDKRVAFAKTYAQMKLRIMGLLALDYHVRDASFQRALSQIGQMENANV